MTFVNVKRLVMMVNVIGIRRTCRPATLFCSLFVIRAPKGQIVLDSCIVRGVPAGVHQECGDRLPYYCLSTSMNINTSVTCSSVPENQSYSEYSRNTVSASVTQRLYHPGSGRRRLGRSSVGSNLSPWFCPTSVYLNATNTKKMTRSELGYRLGKSVPQLSALRFTDRRGCFIAHINGRSLNLDTTLL